MMNADEQDPSSVKIPWEEGECLLKSPLSKRAIDDDSHAAPSFFILGAQKAGTTSMFQYIMQHPLMVTPRGHRETHSLDWRWDGDAVNMQERRDHCLSFYYARKLKQHPLCLTGDSTPSYLLDSLRVIPRLKEVFPWPTKFLVMARDPVKRAYSHYQMITDKGHPQWLHLSFQEVVQRDLVHMSECGLIPYWNMEDATVNQAMFDEFVGTEQELQAWNRYLRDVPVRTGAHTPVARGMYALQLRPWFHSFEEQDFLVINTDDLKSKTGVRSTMERVWKHLGVPNIQIQDHSAKNTREYDKMDDAILYYLQRFYEPHNRRLAEILGSEWKDVWSYSKA